MKKSFMKIPSGAVDRIIFSANLAQAISGKPVTKEEILSLLEKKDLPLDEDLHRQLKENFPHLSF